MMDKPVTLEMRGGEYLLNGKPLAEAPQEQLAWLAENLLGEEVKRLENLAVAMLLQTHRDMLERFKTRISPWKSVPIAFLIVWSVNQMFVWLPGACLSLP